MFEQLDTTELKAYQNQPKISRRGALLILSLPFLAACGNKNAELKENKQLPTVTPQTIIQEVDEPFGKVRLVLPNGSEHVHTGQLFLQTNPDIIDEATPVPGHVINTDPTFRGEIIIRLHNPILTLRAAISDNFTKARSSKYAELTSPAFKANEPHQFGVTWNSWNITHFHFDNLPPLYVGDVKSIPSPEFKI